ncbi:NAD(+) hydrolase sarm1 isoform X2 [Microplitis demolitor]|uniref:NAD(+) hydrolase sarm1 isoform X2 n=1 Tax=Microplitis demolitor TaxID=69319 RepID=UPI0006D50059|nr:NAD(+) hydrolase sarm1 isoform X2 [Microplitis demolitor]
MVINNVIMPSFTTTRHSLFSKIRPEMSEFPSELENGDIRSRAGIQLDINKDFPSKNNFGTRTHPQTSALSQRHQSQGGSSSSSSSSTTSSSSSTKTRSVLSTITSSSKKELNAVKTNITDLRTGIDEMKTIYSRSHRAHNLDRDGSASITDDDQPVVTFPDSDTPSPTSLRPRNMSIDSTSQLDPLNSFSDLHHINTPINISSIGLAGQESMKFEEKKMTSTSTTKLVTDRFSAEKATANCEEMRALQAGDVSYKEESAATAARARVEVDGVSAEKSVATAREQRSLKAANLSHQESNNLAASSMKLQSDSFSSEKTAMAAQQQRQTVTSSGISNQKYMTSSSQSSVTIASSKEVTSSTAALITAASAVNHLLNGPYTEDDLLALPLDDLTQLCTNATAQDVEKARQKYSALLDKFVEFLKSSTTKAPCLLNKIHSIIQKAWAVPTHGHELGYTLCNTLRIRGGLDFMIKNCVSADPKLQFSSASVLEQCLITENRAYVVEHGLDEVVSVACACMNPKNKDSSYARVGIGILEHLFKHSENTCSKVIHLGGLEQLLFACRMADVEILRHCASALVNLSLYGGAENQELMISNKVPIWIFPLAFQNDDNIKYYACLAIAVLVANKEIEAAVLQSGVLDLLEPFVTSHNPSEFAKSNLAHAHGQAKQWLERLVPVLSSKREEARSLAAFHFCMEAGIKKEQGKTDIFRDIGAIEPLKKVASCPNAVASKYAARALTLIGEEVPHKLSQQVPLWSSEDVKEWVKQIGFGEYSQNFVDSRVDGDLLLQLTEENLKEDIGLTNGIKRRRFTRELQNLKKMADYSSKDSGNLNSFLLQIGQEFSIYTYSLLNAGIDKDYIQNISEDQLSTECGITNSIHRVRIMDAIKNMQLKTLPSNELEAPDKNLDVFVSYRRSNGSQLASLLKVHLQLRGFSVFLDVERLEAGKFDNNLLQSIRQAKHFLLVLTTDALSRCINDDEGKDWVHREIVAALTSQCNIIPIIDNFQWPQVEELPEDMRAVCHFNGVRWIHDYQDACVDKLERFMRGDLPPVRTDTSNLRLGSKDITSPGTPASSNMRHPPAYQRIPSNESQSNKDNSKEAINKDANKSSE